jgi:hypothetical protein
LSSGFCINRRNILRGRQIPKDSNNLLELSAMDYLSQYKKLIRKARRLRTNRKLAKKNGEYFENHHIIPESELKRRNRPKKIIDGNWNKTLLTAKEHFIAHVLLWNLCIKLYGETNTLAIGMGHAVMNFKKRKADIHADYEITSRIYEILKKKFNKQGISEKTREKKRKSMIGKNKGRKQSFDEKDKKSVSMVQNANPWNKGTAKIKNKSKKRPLKNSILWEIRFENNVVIVTDNLYQWCLDTGHDQANIHAISMGKRKRHKNIICAIKLN